MRSFYTRSMGPTRIVRLQFTKRAARGRLGLLVRRHRSTIASVEFRLGATPPPTGRAILPSLTRSRRDRVPLTRPLTPRASALSSSPSPRPRQVYVCQRKHAEDRRAAAGGGEFGGGVGRRAARVHGVGRQPYTSRPAPALMQCPWPRCDVPFVRMGLHNTAESAKIIYIHI